MVLRASIAPSREGEGWLQKLGRPSRGMLRDVAWWCLVGCPTRQHGQGSCSETDRVGCPAPQNREFQPPSCRLYSSAHGAHMAWCECQFAAHARSRVGRSTFVGRRSLVHRARCSCALRIVGLSPGPCQSVLLPTGSPHAEQRLYRGSSMRRLSGVHRDLGIKICMPSLAHPMPEAFSPPLYRRTHPCSGASDAPQQV